MALQLPATAKEITQRAKTDVRRELQGSDPFLRRSYLGAIISGVCNRVFEFYGALTEVERESNPATAIRNLDRWASIWKIATRPGSPALGSIWVDAQPAAVGTLIPVSTRFLSSGGGIYVSQADATVNLASKTISALSASGGVATATSAGHGFASNALVTISGASVSGFNLADVQITVLDADRFTYEVASGVTGSAGGSPVAAAYGCSIAVKSEESGEEFNLDGDAALTFESGTPANVSSPVLAAAPGVIDGSDIEDAETKRSRMLDRIRNPTAQFNASAIRAKALEIPGVTRVWVQEVTPAVGQTTVYFVRDGDVSLIPGTAEVAEVKDRILTIKPVTTAEADVIVSAPVAQATNFTFSAISPNTQSMKDAVRATLVEFFKLKTEVGVDIPQDAYRSAIFNTRDPVTGSSVASFTLSTPSGTIDVDAGEIATLGTVSI